jgi:hypothetical protein
MTLGQKIVDKLNVMRQMENQMSFSLKHTGEESGYVIEENMDDIRLRAEIQDFDKYSYLVKTISATRLQPHSPSILFKDWLLRQAAEIERRISYLLESFRLVELDEANNIAQVRSTAPHQRNEETLYYEILLDKGSRLTFTRYSKTRQKEERQPVPSHLTEETLERLVDDLAAVLRLN